PSTTLPCSPRVRAKGLGSISGRLVRQADTRVDGVIDLARTQVQADLETSEAGDAELAQMLSELRLIKDDHEIDALREAIAITRAGFDNVVASLPQALDHR